MLHAKTPGRYYINEIETLSTGTPWTWCPIDDRAQSWKDSQEKYGFDERELWNGYSTMLMLIYERLRWWQEHMPELDYSHLRYKHCDKDMSYDEALSFLIESIKLHITLDNLDPGREGIHKERLTTWQNLFAEIGPSIGW